MWIRLTVAESPIFQKTLDAKSAAQMPVLDALKTYPKEIALAAGSFVATNATFYVGSVWLVSYATTELGYDRTTILNANAALSLSDIPMILAFGLLSDYVGRRKMFLTGMAGLALFAVPYFMLVSPATSGCSCSAASSSRPAAAQCTGRSRPTSPSSSPPECATAAARWPTSSPRSSGAWRR